MTGRLPALLLALGVAILAAEARAEEMRQVPPGGDLQDAIDHAAAGDILVLEAGEHRGPVVVSRPLTLRGQAGARLVGDRRGSVVTIEADDVRLEQLEITGSGHNLSRDDAGVFVLGDNAHLANLTLRDNLHGVYVRRAHGVRLVDNHVAGLAAGDTEARIIGAEAYAREDAGHHAPPRVQALMGNGLHLFNANGAVVEDNHIHHARDGIYVAHTSDAAFRDNRIHDCRYGIHYMYSSDNTVAGNELWDNVAGPALMFSRNLQVHDNLMRDHGGFRAYGLLLQNVESSQIRRNTIRGNRVGLRLQNSNNNDFRANRVFANLASMTINSSSRDNRFTRNSIGLNMRQIELTGPAPANDWSVDGVGNHWHGALPMDLTGDGISQWPHHEVDLLAATRERFPPIQLLTGSAGVTALEWALARVPLPGTRYITDPHPLVRRPDDD